MSRDGARDHAGLARRREGRRGHRLDAVVADAGAAAYGPFKEMDAGDYRQTIDITLVGVLNTAHAALPHLERGGTLVVVGSIAGRVPTPWMAGYSAAKHGVRGFVRSLSAELRAVRSPVRVALVARPVRSTPPSGAARGRRTGDCRRGCSVPTVRTRLRPRSRVPSTARESSVPSAP